MLRQSRAADDRIARRHRQPGARPALAAGTPAHARPRPAVLIADAGAARRGAERPAGRDRPRDADADHGDRDQPVGSSDARPLHAASDPPTLIDEIAELYEPVVGGGRACASHVDIDPTLPRDHAPPRVDDTGDHQSDRQRIAPRRGRARNSVRTRGAATARIARPLPGRRSLAPGIRRARIVSARAVVSARARQRRVALRRRRGLALSLIERGVAPAPRRQCSSLRDNRAGLCSQRSLYTFGPRRELVDSGLTPSPTAHLGSHYSATPVFGGAMCALAVFLRFGLQRDEMGCAAMPRPVELGETSSWHVLRASTSRPTSAS